MFRRRKKKKTATNITTCLVLSDFVCLDADQIYYKYLTGRCKGIMHIFCTMQQKWQREPHTFAGNCLLQSSIVYMHSLAVWKHEKLSAWFCRNPGCKTLVNTIVPAHGERERYLRYCYMLPRWRTSWSPCLTPHSSCCRRFCSGWRQTMAWTLSAPLSPCWSALEMVHISFFLFFL